MTDKDYKALYEQAKWERDVAVAQLEELGYQLGENVDLLSERLKRKCCKLISADCGDFPCGLCPFDVKASQKGDYVLKRCIVGIGGFDND